MTGPALGRRDDASPSVSQYSVELRELAERLAVEYAGAVPPGRVMALVYRLGRVVGRDQGDGRLEATESLVRQLLTEQLATMNRFPDQRTQATRRGWID